MLPYIPVLLLTPVALSMTENTQDHCSGFNIPPALGKSTQEAPGMTHKSYSPMMLDGILLLSNVVFFSFEPGEIHL